jgi:predicted nucleotidyltransferase
MTKTNQEIIELVEKNNTALRSLGVRKLGLFGSCARNEANSNSDVDFLVDFEKKTFDAYMDLKFFLQDLLGKKIDLITVGSIKPRLRERILAETIYAKGL